MVVQMGFVEVGCNHDLIAISPHCTGKCNPDGMALFGRDFSRLEALIGVVRNVATGFSEVLLYPEHGFCRIAVTVQCRDKKSLFLHWGFGFDLVGCIVQGG